MAPLALMMTSREEIEMKHYMAIDQYGGTYHGLKNPRKDLLERFGRKKASKMYIESKTGEVRHTGYVIAGLWLTVYEVSAWSKAR